MEKEQVLLKLCQKKVKEKKTSFLRKMQLGRAINPDKSNYFILCRNAR